jgi:hypothetical protein
MDQKMFWTIVDRSREKAGGAPDAHSKTLEAALLELDADDIEAFDRMFRSYLAQAYSWDLWGAAYIIGGGCSDDGFTDFRAWLISKGQAVYEAALRDADSLADVVGETDGDAQFEEFTYAASKAWEQKLNKAPEDFPWEDSGQAAEPSGEPWDEDDDALAARFPKLFSRFCA